MTYSYSDNGEIDNKNIVNPLVSFGIGMQNQLMRTFVSYEATGKIELSKSVADDYVNPYTGTHIKWSDDIVMKDYTTHILLNQDFYMPDFGLNSIGIDSYLGMSVGMAIHEMKIRGKHLRSYTVPTPTELRWDNYKDTTTNNLVYGFRGGFEYRKSDRFALVYDISIMKDVSRQATLKPSRAGEKSYYVVIEGGYLMKNRLSLQYFF